MFRGGFPVSRRVADGFGDTDRAGLTAPCTTQLVGKFHRSGCRSCSVVSVKHVCLGIGRLGFFFGVESEIVCVADIARGVGSLGQLFTIPSASPIGDRAGPMAMAPGESATRKLNEKRRYFEGAF